MRVMPGSMVSVTSINAAKCALDVSSINRLCGVAIPALLERMRCVVS